MVTTAVLAVTLAIAVPSMSQLRQRQKAIATANLLVTHLNFARHHAVTKRVNTTICPSSNMHTCLSNSDWTDGWIVFSDQDGNRRPDDAEDILWAELASRSGALLLTSSAGRSSVRYLQDGRSSGSNVTINVCADNTLINQIIINNAGRIRLARPQTATPCS